MLYICRNYLFLNVDCANFKINMRTFYIIIIAVLALVFLVFSYSFVYRVFISPTVETEIESQNNEIIETRTIQIEILNGTNVNGLAKRMMNWLRRRDFDVLNTGNWKHDSLQTTMIYDRLGNIKASKNVAAALGISDSLVFIKPDSSLFLNTTVIIGSDYKKLKPFK